MNSKVKKAKGSSGSGDKSTLPKSKSSELKQSSTQQPKQVKDAVREAVEATSKPAAAKTASKSAKSAAAATGDYCDQDPQVQRILQVRELMMQRDVAKQRGEFVRADELRARLQQQFGAEIIDQPRAPSGFKFRDNSSKKLPTGFVVPDAFKEKRQQHEQLMAQLRGSSDLKTAAATTTAATASSNSSNNNSNNSNNNNKRKLEQQQVDDSSSSSSSKKEKKVNKKAKTAAVVETATAPAAKEEKTAAAEKTNKKSAAKAPVAAAVEKTRNSALLQSVLVGSDSSTGSGSSKATATTATAVRLVQGVRIEELQLGAASAAPAAAGQRVKVLYCGRLQSTGKIFDSSLKRPFTFRLGRGEVIRGWDIGVAGMRPGGKRRLTIPPEKAYGRSGSPPVIPANATLIFDVTLQEAK